MVKGIIVDGQQPASNHSDLITASMLRKAWLRDQRISGVELAGRFGVKPSRVSNILSTGECPSRYIKILRSLGMPEELLPAPSREKPGPPGMTPSAQPASQNAEQI